MTSKRFSILICFIISVLWAIAERAYGIGVSDQVALAGIFGVALLWMDE